MKLIKSKKGISFLLVIAIAAISAVGAFAYWTTTGAGNGSATNASANGTIVLHASFAGGLYPGGSKSVSFTADNAGASNLWVETISLKPVGPVTVDAGHASCVVADFTMPDVLSQTNVLAGALGQPVAGAGTVSFANTGDNQDACKGAIITLNLVSN